MPSIWKRFSKPNVEPYHFPTAEEMVVRLPEEPSDQAVEEWEDQPSSVIEEKEDRSDPVSYAQHQAESILRDAKRQAEEILAHAQEEALEEAQEIREKARKEGFDQGVAEGISRGMAQAMEESVRAREEKAAALERDVQAFLERAGAALDRQMDENLEELRDLAIAIAEKVVCVSLKSSEAVIGRMIQNAVDKRKRKEWAHIYIAECDVKRLTPIPSSLSDTLVALSDRVRIIPMADDEAGTCIIELPDEIVDASASTQLGNIRTMLHETPLSRAFDPDMR